MRLNDDITTIKGIGEKTALLFSKASVFCVNDLIHYFPRRYKTFPKCTSIKDLDGAREVVVCGNVVKSPSVFGSKGKTVIAFDVNDGTGIIHVYYFGMPYLKNNFTAGKKVILYGQYSDNSKGKCLSQPKILTEEEYKANKGRILPLYPLIKGLSNNTVSKSVKACIGICDELKDYLSPEILASNQLMSIKEALTNIHFPECMEDVYKARERLSFDEFLSFIIKINALKNGNVKLDNNYRLNDFNASDELINRLPYKLTKPQLQSYNDIKNDISGPYLMNRLLQGDVGSGKTIIAILASLNAVINGYQAAIMAPTEVLACQHYDDIVNMTKEYNLPFKPCLLTGSVTSKNKKDIKYGLKTGEYNLVIGTHALIQEDVEFDNLALCVCDEQHRFGVRQRLNLLNKGENVHVLVMSATPIPRTLGLILYGDLDISIINELPANRLPIKNSVLDESMRPKIYRFIEERLKEGRQCYIICPMVEEGVDDSQDLCDVTGYSDKLSSIFTDRTVSMLHGKMKNKEKNEIMNSFKNGDIDILVSTTVVEVGINVPNASVIVIENAERFGLAQLHQLRGRVGRGKYQSYCMFVSSSKSKKTRERLDIIGNSNDGFKIASEDLKQRGPGDFFGYKQSGVPMFKISDIYSDSRILGKARDVYEQYGTDIISNIKSDSIKNTGFTLVDFHFVCL